MNYTIREMKLHEYKTLEDFLYEAIYIPEGMDFPQGTITKQPELQLYISEFGNKDDNALVAEVDGKIGGAVWTRIMNDYGQIDDETPSFAISLYKEYRGLGIGTDMMKQMLMLLKNKGYKQASFAVQEANYAVKMYQ
ncbi:MAG: GNAT family N-acetyltransferase [Anaerovoracaceae bacterium]